MVIITLLILSFLSLFPASKAISETSGEIYNGNFSFFPEVKYDLYIMSLSLSPTEQDKFFTALNKIEDHFANHLSYQIKTSCESKSNCLNKPLREIGECWVNFLACFMKENILKEAIKSVILGQISGGEYINFPSFDDFPNNVDISCFSKRSLVTSLMARHLLAGINVLRPLLHRFADPKAGIFISENIAAYTAFYNRANATSKYCRFNPHILFFKIKNRYFAELSPPILLRQWVRDLIPVRLTILYKKLNVPFDPIDFFFPGYSLDKLLLILKLQFPDEYLPDLLSALDFVSSPPFGKFKKATLFLLYLIELNQKETLITLNGYEMMLHLWKLLSNLSITFYNVVDPFEAKDGKAVPGLLSPPSPESSIVAILKLEDRVVLYK